MTATLAAPPVHLRASTAPTLDAVLVEAWNDLSSRRRRRMPGLRRPDAAALDRRRPRRRRPLRGLRHDARVAL